MAKIFRNIEVLRDELRKKLGDPDQSLRSLVEKLEIGKTTLIAFRDGERSLKSDSIQKLAEYFDVKYQFQHL